MMTPLESGTAVIIAVIGATPLWLQARKTKSIATEARDIVKGNGHGDVAKMVEQVMFQLGDLSTTVAFHVSDENIDRELIKLRLDKLESPSSGRMA